MIFLHAASHEGDSQTALTLVNRRFRHIIFATPELWTHISSGEPLSHVDAFVRNAARNRHTPLSVTIAEDKNYRPDWLPPLDDGVHVGLISFLHLVKATSEQWDHVTFSGDCTAEFQEFYCAKYPPKPFTDEHDE